MREADTDSLRRRAAAARAKQAEKQPPKPEPRPKRAEPAPQLPEGLDDGLGELDERVVAGAEADVYMRGILEGVTIDAAYRMYVEKPFPNREPDSKGELTVSCPVPGHADKHPSANINVATNLWTCYGCGDGGDAIHLIARNLGLDPRVPQDYMELTKRVCKDLGHEFISSVSGRESIVIPGRPETPTGPEVPVHGDGSGLEDLFDPEAALAAGDLTKKTPEPLGDDHSFLLDVYDGADDLGPKLKDGRSQRDALLDSARKRIGAEKPVKKAPKAPKIPPNSPKTVEKGAKFDKFDTTPPKFAVPKGLQSKTAQKAPKADQTAAKPAQKAPKASEDADSAMPGGYDELEKGITPDKLPTIDFRDIVPSGTFIYDYCEVGSAQRDVTQEFHFWNAVMAVGLALGRQVCLFDSPPVYANFFICSVAGTGERKTKANRLLNKLIRDTFEWSEETSSGVQMIDSIGSGEVLIDAFAGKRKDPTDKNKFLYGSKISGLVAPNELSSLSNVMRREGVTLEPVLIGLYDAQEVVSTRSRNSGHVEAKEPFCSLMTTVQPPVVRELISGRMVQSGFANRFLWTFGPPGDPEAIGDPTRTLEGVSRLVMQLRGIHNDMMSIAPHPGLRERAIDWDPEAAKAFSNFFYQTIKPAKDRDSTGLATRLDLVMKKLILVFTANMRKTSVPPEAVQQAIKLWPYMIRCYELVGVRLSGSVRKDAEQEVVDAIAAVTANMGQAPTATEIWKRRLWRSPSIDSREDMRRILETLVKTGMVREIPSKRSVRLALNGD